MAIQVGYMGTKKYLARHMREVIDSCPPGPVLDVFSGMGSVAEALASSRQVWMNDVQFFASEVARALFASRSRPVDRDGIMDQFIPLFEQNKQRLLNRFRETIRDEDGEIAAGTVQGLLNANQIVRSRIDSAFVYGELRRLQLKSTEPYRLFALSYSGKYFSLRQTIEIDSLRYAIDAIHIADEQKRWMLLALGVAMLRASASTGHFAQYLSPKAANLQFLLRQRRRSIFETFWIELSALAPVGTQLWRSKNRVFRHDAIQLLEQLGRSGNGPAVVYADPPYTDDQYSRFYHLWETLILYDYPVATGKGCYRAGRFRTPFALKSEVEGAVNALACAASKTGAHFVLSYPVNGLLSTIPIRIEDIVKRHYRSCKAVRQIKHEHSTMGASNGRAKNLVTEMVYLARN
jgi:adenine-specific DNA-methyltransferase